MIKSSSQLDRILLEVGCYLAELGSSRLKDFKDLAQRCALSENYQFRIYATIILKVLGESIPKHQHISLPATYSMVFPKPQGNSLIKEEENHDGGKTNWRDASSIMKVASHWSGYLEYCSGIDRRTIDCRAVELMKQYGDTTKANENNDESIRNHFNAINLRYSYKKTYAQPALDGMLCVASELKDGGAVRGHYLDSVFMSRDFKNISVIARCKPDFVQRIAEPESSMEGKNWINEAELSPRFSDDLPQYEGYVVIGENCHIKKMGFKFPIEEYQSKISFDEKKMDEPIKHSIFGESPFMRYSVDYLKSGWGDSETILLRSGYFTDFFNKSHWIAINPVMAEELGYEPCDEGYFAWVNDKGERVLESIYWQCGNFNGHSSSNYEASEGWMVIAKQEVIDKLSKKSPIFIHKMVLRHYEENRLDTKHRSYQVFRLAQ